jgi:hypothetical protein
MKSVLLLVFIFIQLFLVGLFLPDSYEIKKSVFIDNPIDTIFDQLTAETVAPLKQNPETKFILETIVKNRNQFNADTQVNGTTLRHRPKNDLSVENKILLTPQREGTRILWIQTEKLNCFSRYLAPILESMGEKRIEKALSKIKGHIEAQLIK